MPTTQLDKEIAAYIRGRRDELNDVYKVLEIVRRYGHIDLDTASIIIDYLSRVDRRALEMKEDGE
jgi:hypothetical protein